MTKITALLLLSSSLAFPVVAQTAVWQMPPSNYEAITRLNTNLYRVTRNGKIGLIHADGTVVAEVNNDEIGLFYEHLALVTRTDGTGERVSGCLTDDGRYNNFSERYYTLSGQKFYSDGLLTVSDATGKVGYIDSRGNRVLGFDGKYDRIKPFVEGHAAVFKNKKYSLIDKDGSSVRFQFKGVAEIYGGTNVYRGLAYVWDGDGRFYTYDVNRGGYCNSVKLSTEKPSFDYLYCFSVVTGRNKTVPFQESYSSGAKGLSAASMDGGWGYRTLDQQVVLPGQFSDATPFEDGFAVVTLDGSKGILNYIDGARFDLITPGGVTDFYDHDAVTLRLEVSVPQVWMSRQLSLEVRDGEGTLQPLSDNGGYYTFTIHPTASVTLAFNVAIRGEGLVLYKGTASYTVKQHHRCTICGKDLDVCGGKHQEIKGSNSATIEKCPTCGLKITDCKYQGVH